jgi:hypothetical protein
MAKENLGKVIKDLGWDYIALTKAFKGAVKTYQNVAFGFGMGEAFIVEDGQGLFFAEDIKTGILRNKDVDIEELDTIYGVSFVAWFDAEEAKVVFNQELVDRFNLTAADIEDIAMRIRLLDRLGETIEIKLFD